MKICFLADAQSVHIHQLTRHLSRLGHNIHVLTHKPAVLPEASVERFRVPAPGVSNLRRWSGRRQAYLLSFFRKFDVVNMHFVADWGLGDVLSSPDDRKARFVVTAWGSDIVDPPGEQPADCDLKAHRVWLLRSSDRVTTCGPSFARTVARYAELPLEAISVIPFGVDQTIFCPALAIQPRDNSPTIGFFKGFRNVYGARILIRAIPKILAKVPSARFEMIGDGPELAKCQDMAAALGVTQAIRWLGRMPHEALPQRIRTWQLSIIPSIHEAFGVAALESQAMGVPVIASNVGGLADTVVDRKTGILFPVGDSKALSDAVINILDSDQLHAKMSQAGIERVHQLFDWGQVATQWSRFYARLREQTCIMV